MSSRGGGGTKKKAGGARGSQTAAEKVMTGRPVSTNLHGEAVRGIYASPSYDALVASLPRSKIDGEPIAPYDAPDGQRHSLYNWGGVYDLLHTYAPDSLDKLVVAVRAQAPKPAA